ECWLSDKDRFSYEGLNSDDRLTHPMIKRGGKWVETDWTAVLEHTAGELKRIRDRDGAAAIGALVSPHSTLEEMHLAPKLVRRVAAEGRQQGDRGALRAAAHARGDRSRCGEHRRQAHAGSADRHRAFVGRERHRREPCRW